MLKNAKRFTKMIFRLCGADIKRAVPVKKAYGWLIKHNIATGCVFHGFGDFVNCFLCAHGKGKEIRNGTYVMGASIVVGCLVLVPMFGAIGAAVTKLISGILYCCMMCYYYGTVEVEVGNSSLSVH